MQKPPLHQRLHAASMMLFGMVLILSLPFSLIFPGTMISVGFARAMQITVSLLIFGGILTVFVMFSQRSLQNTKITRLMRVTTPAWVLGLGSGLLQMSMGFGLAGILIATPCALYLIAEVLSIRARLRTTSASGL